MRRRKEVAAGESDHRPFLKEADEGSFGEFCSYSRSRLLMEWGRNLTEHKKRDVLQGNSTHLPQTDSGRGWYCFPVSFLLSRVRKELVWQNETHG